MPPALFNRVLLDDRKIVLLGLLGMASDTDIEQLVFELLFVRFLRNFRAKLFSLFLVTPTL